MLIENSHQIKYLKFHFEHIQAYHLVRVYTVIPVYTLKQNLGRFRHILLIQSILSPYFLHYTGIQQCMVIREMRVVAIGPFLAYM